MLEIQPEHLRQFLGCLLKDCKRSVATLNGYRVAIRYLWRWFYEYEVGPAGLSGPEVDPLRGLPLAKTPERVVDDHPVHALQDSSNGSTPQDRQGRAWSASPQTKRAFFRGSVSNFRGKRCWAGAKSRLYSLFFSRM